VPSFRRRGSVPDADAADAMSLAEEADAEAAEADAIAAAARARARAIRLRRQAAEAAEATETAEATVVTTVVEDTKADEPSSDSKDGERRRWRTGLTLKVLAAGVAFGCASALITLSVLMVLNHRQHAAEQQRRAEYAAAARQSVVTLMSLDFNKAKDDVQRIIDDSTGSFRDDFKNQADDFIQVAQDSKVITEVTVNAVGVETMTNDSAVVLLSASSRVSNSAGAKQEPRTWRLSVNMQRDGGQIKMAKVEFVP
jgi:Mce-associated membrane protein